MLANMMRDAMLDLLDDMIDSPTLRSAATELATGYYGDKKSAGAEVNAARDLAHQFVAELRR